MFFSGCSGSVSQNSTPAAAPQPSPKTTGDVKCSNTVEPLNYTPAFMYFDVLPFRVRLTTSGKLLCKYNGKSAYLYSVNGSKVTLQDVPYGFYPAKDGKSCTVVFKRKNGKKFTRTVRGTSFTETLSSPVYCTEPYFDYSQDGEFIPCSSEEQRVRVVKECGAVKRAIVTVRFVSDLEYPCITLDSSGYTIYPECVGKSKAVFRVNYLPGDVTVTYPFKGVTVEKVSVKGQFRNGHTKKFRVKHPSEDPVTFRFECKDSTATAKLVTPQGDVFHFSRESVKPNKTVYSVTVPSTVKDIYKVKLYSKSRCKKLRVEPL